MIVPTLPEFKALAKGGKLVPVYREVLADLDTPVSAFRKVDEGPYAFLLESVEGGEKWGRYSILGSRPSLVFVAWGERCEIQKVATCGGQRLDLLRRHVGGHFGCLELHRGSRLNCYRLQLNGASLQREIDTLGGTNLCPDLTALRREADVPDG